MHYDEAAASFFADFVNRLDVRMIQRRGGLSFANEPFFRLRVGAELFDYVVVRDSL